MFFADHEKRIYSPEGSDLKFDPLALDRALTRASDGRLNDLLEAWQAGDLARGDVSESKASRALVVAEAEGELARVARSAFGLPDFPECCDATALEYLCDFLGWMEGKGSRGSAPPPSPSPSDSAGFDSTTTPSSSCTSTSNGPAPAAWSTSPTP